MADGMSISVDVLVFSLIHQHSSMHILQKMLTGGIMVSKNSVQKKEKNELISENIIISREQAEKTM